MITLHHVEQTRSMRTLWLLHELEVPFEVSIHALSLIHISEPTRPY